jgi:threonine dehydratase
MNFLFLEYHKIKQLTHLTRWDTKKITTYADGNIGSGLGQACKCGGVQTME